MGDIKYNLSMDKKSIAFRIKKARKEMKMSQRDLGEALNLSDKAISSYESGRATPPLKTLKLLSKVTKKPLSYFTDEQIDLTEFSIKTLLNNIENQLKEIKEILNSKNLKEISNK